MAWGCCMARPDVQESHGTQEFEHDNEDEDHSEDYGDDKSPAPATPEQREAKPARFSLFGGNWGLGGGDTGSTKSVESSSQAVLDAYGADDVSVDEPRLFVHLVEAHGLAKKDFFGLSDPYCKVTLDGVTMSRSEVIGNTLDPVWNETLCVVSLSRTKLLEKKKSMVLEFFDDDTSPWGDTFMGQITVPVEDIPLIGKKVDKSQESPIPVPTWRDLKSSAAKPKEKVQGSVLVAMWWGAAMHYKQGVQSQLEYEQPKVSILNVEVLRGRMLTPRAGAGTSNPFVQLKIDDNRFRTVTKNRTLNPVWNERFLIPVTDPIDDAQLTLTVFDYDEPHKEPLGFMVVPLNKLPKSLGAKTVLARWFPLRPTKNRKEAESPGVMVGDLQIRMFFEEGYKDARPKPPLGTLSLHLHRALDLLAGVSGMNTKSLDLPDPYAIIQLGNKWVRTTTAWNTVFPEFDTILSLPVHDVTDVLHIVLFWDNTTAKKTVKEKFLNIARSKDTLLGRIDIQVCTLQVNKVYSGVHPLHMPVGGQVRKTGELVMDLQYKATALEVHNLHMFYISDPLPALYYRKPLSKKEMKVIKHETARLVIQGLAAKNPPIRPEVATEVLMHKHAEFSGRRLKSHMQRVKDLLPDTQALSSACTTFMSWRYPYLNVLANAAFIFLVYNPGLIPPMFGLANILAFLVCYIRRPSPMLFNLTTTSTTGDHSTKKDLSEMEEYEEAMHGSLGDAGGERQSKNPVKQMKATINNFKGQAAEMQNTLSDVADMLERLHGVFSFADPRGSRVFMMGCGMATLTVSILPFRFCVALGGTFLMRHPDFKNPTPALPINVLNRLPTRSLHVL